MCVVFLGGKGGGGWTPYTHGHKESYKDLNLKRGLLEIKITLKEFLVEHNCIIRYLLIYIS